MLDQDTARALLTIADEAGARVALVGDRHQLPAVGRGGVLDHAVAWAHPTAVVSMDTVHRFTDPDYATLSLKMRTGDDPVGVFDELAPPGPDRDPPLRGRTRHSTRRVGRDRCPGHRRPRDQVADLNAAIRDHRAHERHGRARVSHQVVTTSAGERIGVGDRVATRRNDTGLQVANRQTWTVTGIGDDGSVSLHGHGRDREIPADYVTRFVELAYATTVHGAQGDTVDRAHVVIGEHTNAAAAYVAMTRGRHSNTAHLVAESVEDARRQWLEVFGRDRADLGPAHARGLANEAIDRYGAAAAPPPPPRLPAPRYRPPSSQPSGIGF